jgi:transcription elongation factor GreA
MDDSKVELMSAEGFERLKQKLSNLESKLSDLRMHKGQEAIFAGDMWHDNPVLYRVEAEERALMREIALAREQIKNAKFIIATEQVSSVCLGCEVRIRFSDGLEESYKILGDADSNPSAGVVSYKSPLGNALLDRRIGEKAMYYAGGRLETVEVLSITILGPHD